MEKKHSGLGIGSFVTSIVSGILIFVLIMVAGVLEASTPGGMDEESAAAIIVGLLVLGFMFLCVISLGLGIAGLIQKNRRKIFAILGTIFSSMSLMGTLSLIVIGLAMG